MPLLDFLPRLPVIPPARSTGVIISCSVATTLTLIGLARFTLQTTPPKPIPSPRVTQLPNLSETEKAKLPYPPDSFPGARDVDSPYGIIRVYEWGPEKGRKVLLVPGISTPCVSLGGMAHALVEKGCRVLVMELWGRGYSDHVDLPHDSRLYATEILIAITSSPLAWTPEGFSLIGYSLGGGICTDFAVSFPDLVRGLVLLAPSGMLRPHHVSLQSRFLYSGIMPESLLRWIVRRRLGVASAPDDTQTPQDPGMAAVGEEIRGTDSSQSKGALLSVMRPHATAAGAVKWQLDYHKGFVGSFVSSMQYATIAQTKETIDSWRRLGLRDDKVIIIVGESDPIVIPHELKQDTFDTIGADNVEWRVIESGHEFPMTHAQEVVNEICGVWGI